MIHRELVPGKLQIVRRIGVGGMGVVYEAIHLGLDRRVAVKVIHPQAAESADARTRFLREARALALLQSEHVVQVLDVDILAEGDPYMVMEYLEGRDLKRELTKRGPLPVAEAVGYVVQAAGGLAAAHRAGIIHRDIKPANIFITNLDGARRIKLLDFGVAKFCAAADQSLTRPTDRLGTPLYMSPEQFAGMDADAHCDLWALGVVLFQLLTGYSPFRPKGSEGTVGAILNGMPESLHEAREDVPLALSQVVARCFERVPAERFTDVSEFAEALAAFGPREPTVRASWRVPRGSSAPPPVGLLDKALAQPAIAPRPPELVSIRELITVTHPNLVERPAPRAPAELAALSASPTAPPVPAGQEADPDATIQYRESSPSNAQTAAPPMATVSALSKSEHPSSPANARGKKLATQVGSLLLLALLLVIAWPLFVPKAGAPTISAPRDTTAIDATLEIARPHELAVATTEPALAAQPAGARMPLAPPNPSAPEPTSPTARHSRSAQPIVGNSASARRHAATATGPAPKPTPPSPVGSAAVPLHL